MTSSYILAELREDAEGGITLRGGAKRLWQCKAQEVLLSGPADTGKTFACLQKLDALLWKYPGAQAVMLRKTLNSLYPSCWQTYLKILGPKPPVSFYGGEKPEWVNYPNGSRLYIAGLDNPQKALSSERDFIYGNQVEEWTLEDWETLLTRCSGRAGNAPYAQLYGDCNPGPPTHWIKQRASLTLIESRHEDNPTLYTQPGALTEGGARRMAVLDALTGVRYQRLRLGKWVTAEGVVYEGWDTDLHLIDPFPIPSDWPRYWAVDFGYTNPFVWGDFAIDPDGRIYLTQEIYRTQTLVEDAAMEIKMLTAEERYPVEIICDHDAEDRATLERHLGLPTMAAYKSVSDGIQAVQLRLRKAGDGKPRLYVFRDACRNPDAALVEARKPASTEQEFDTYAWPVTPDGKPVKEEPMKLYDHGLDRLRYLVARLDLKPDYIGRGA